MSAASESILCGRSILLHESTSWHPCCGQCCTPGCFQAQLASTMHQLESSKTAPMASVPASHAGQMRQPALQLQHNDIPGLLDLCSTQCLVKPSPLNSRLLGTPVASTVLRHPLMLHLGQDASWACRSRRRLSTRASGQAGHALAPAPHRCAQCVQDCLPL